MRRLVAFNFIMVIILSISGVKSYGASPEKINELRGCYISYIDIQNNLKDLSKEQFEAKISSMYDELIKYNINTIYMHVRPMGDAIYPSDIYPVSRYISSSGELDYDPLEIMVNIAHNKKLRIEAWINPYRLSLGNDTTAYYKTTDFYRNNSRYIIEYQNPSGEMCLSLNPASPEAINCIISGVKEIITGYDVDGIHFDDYFYVPGMGTELSIEEKMNNVNLLVSNVYNTIKSINCDCKFGISPAGNIDYAKSQGVDVGKWLSENGYIDYIIPQIYWTDNYYTNNGVVNMFSDRIDKWKSLNTNATSMYVALALYRAGEISEAEPDWSQKDNNLYCQYQKAKAAGYEGYVIFRYDYLHMDASIEEMKHLCDIEDKRNDGVLYSTRINGRWQSNRKNGVISGDINGEQAVKGLYITSMTEGVEVGFRFYNREYGMSKWITNGYSYNVDNDINAIMLGLRGENSKNYYLRYRVKVEGIWDEWCTDGEIAGELNSNKRINAVQISILPR